jgi:hypothetical protein
MEGEAQQAKKKPRWLAARHEIKILGRPYFAMLIFCAFM